MRYRPGVLSFVAVLIALLLPASAAAVPNQSGRLATTTLVDLGSQTSALVVFASNCRTSRNSPDRTPNNSPPGLVRFFYPFGAPFSSLTLRPGRRLGR